MRNFVVWALLLSASTTHVSFAGQPQTLERSPDGGRPGMNYYFYANAANEDGQLQPLLLFLHGGGEGGGEPALVKTHGPPQLIESGKSFAGFVVSPQNPSKSQFWDDQQLAQLIDHLMETLPVDPDRIYLTGMSRGCYGAWHLAIQNPDRFAAMVGICGGGPAPYANRVADMPIRLFHGADDPLIPTEESQRMLVAHRAAGGDCELTIYPDTEHDAWTQTYENEKIFDWLYDQRRQ